MGLPESFSNGPLTMPHDTTRFQIATIVTKNLQEWEWEVFDKLLPFSSQLSRYELVYLELFSKLSYRR